MDLLHGSKYLRLTYEFGKSHPEIILVIGLIVFLLFRRKFKSALLLIFGIALCFANYYVISEYQYLGIPFLFTALFACISIVLLLLLVYQLIQST